jgi:hypothetical protein
MFGQTKMLICFCVGGTLSVGPDLSRAHITEALGKGYPLTSLII